MKTLYIYNDCIYDSPEEAEHDGALHTIEIPNTEEAYLAASLVFNVMAKETFDSYSMVSRKDFN